MVNPTNLAIMKRWFHELYTLRRESVIEELLAPDVLVHGLGYERRGRDQFREFYALIARAFRRLDVTVEDAQGDGDVIAIRCHATGEHVSGRRVAFEGGGFLKVRDGVIVEAWNCWDFLTMLEQVGAIRPNALSLLVEHS